MKTIDQLKLEKFDLSFFERNVERVVPPKFISAELSHIDKRIQDYVLLPKGAKKGLYLFGECGTGKTYALYSIYKIIIANGRDAVIYNSPALLRLIKKDYSNKYEHNFDDLLEYKGIVLIDDIGAEKVTDWVEETLYSLINERYEQMRPTLFTSNYDLDQLAQRVGDRITSRIVEMCHIINLSGGDRRLSN